jgi:hypothetical protein
MTIKQTMVALHSLGIERDPLRLLTTPQFVFLGGLQFLHLPVRRIIICYDGRTPSEIKVEGDKVTDCNSCAAWDRVNPPHHTHVMHGGRNKVSLCNHPV